MSKRRATTQAQSDSVKRHCVFKEPEAFCCHRKTGVNCTEPPIARPSELLSSTALWALQQPHYEQGERAWLHARTFALTASTAPVALHAGMIHYFRRRRADERPLECYEYAELELDTKCGFAAPFEGNEATRHGTLHEPIALESFVERNRVNAVHVGLLMHRQHRWLGASPDAMCFDGSLVEIKVPKSRSFKVGDPVPPHYWIQCQIQMAVCEADRCHYYEYRVPSQSKRARIKEPRINQQLVKRDREWFDAALPLLQAFAETMYRLKHLAALYQAK